jgi:hypothetical protein
MSILLPMFGLALERIPLSTCRSVTRATYFAIPLTYRGRVGESKITGNIKGVFTTGKRRLLYLSMISKATVSPII